MATRFLLFSAVFLFCFGSAFGGVPFSTLPRTLVVTASPKRGSALKAGEDSLKVTWAPNGTLPAGADKNYAKVKVKLCYAPISQKDRAWRKTNDDLSKDKTCPFTIVTRPYSAKQESFEWLLERDVPTATYFVRAYALNAAGDQVVYGQTTDGRKSSNLFEVEAITGRHASLDIAAACFSAFSVVSLVGFFYAEKRKARRSASPAQ
ncbi:high-affinity nitrate transporter 3.1-like [Aristolochia californica]|uniref:high-affinity nitrate transporter 3.1-like n=1 Tax=Aristolochia californica TaxID=171875 RepID=UPI0035D636CD